MYLKSWPWYVWCRNADIVAPRCSKYSKYPFSTGVPKARAPKFCTVAHNICVSSVWNLLYVTLLATRILRRLPCSVSYGYLHFGENLSRTYVLKILMAGFPATSVPKLPVLQHIQENCKFKILPAFVTSPMLPTCSARLVSLSWLS